MMQKWQVLTVLAMLCAGVFPVLHNKSVQIHGPLMQMTMISFVFVIFCGCWLVYSPESMQLVTKGSFKIALMGGIVSICSNFLLLNAYVLARGKLSVITITMSFSIVIVALIEHFWGEKLEPHQWLGALIAFLGITLVNLKR